MWIIFVKNRSASLTHSNHSFREEPMDAPTSFDQLIGRADLNHRNQVLFMLFDLNRLRTQPFSYFQVSDGEVLIEH
jgi:hypothetical protein